MNDSVTQGCGVLIIIMSESELKSKLILTLSEKNRTMHGKLRRMELKVAFE